MIGFTGTRNGMTNAQKVTVTQLLQELDAALVGHGDCVGADHEFDEIARFLEIRRVIFPSNIESMRAHCELRGATQITEPMKPLVRNGWIVGASVALIATPKEYQEELRSGTWSTIRRARAAKLTLYLVKPDGKTENDNVQGLAESHRRG
jgi:hypothetical protein